MTRHVSLSLGVTLLLPSTSAVRATDLYPDTIGAAVIVVVSVPVLFPAPILVGSSGSVTSKERKTVPLLVITVPTVAAGLITPLTV